MGAERRLVLLGQTRAVERLRAEGACRALRDDRRTLHLPLDRLLGGERRDDVLASEGDAGPISDSAILETLSLPPTDRRMPMVLLWVSERPGDIATLLDRLATLGARLARLLQADRLPLPIGACVLVAPRGWDDADLEAIRRLESLATASRHAIEEDPLAAVLPTRFAVYVMGDRLRAGPDGSAHEASEAWPLAVSRLLGSIAVSPGRPTGLRAWRAFGLVLDAHESATVEAATLRLVRAAIAPAKVEATTATEDLARGKSRAPVDRHLRVADAPSNRVSVSNSPRHAWDSPDGTHGEQAPQLPTFVELMPASDVTDSLAGAGGGEAVGERLDERHPGSGWPVVKSRRGAHFMHDRFQRVRDALSTVRGPRSIIAGVWSAIHRTPRHLPWFARGGFYRAPEVHDFDRVGRQMIGWSRIGQLDRIAREDLLKAKAQAIELDLARAHFLGTGWRVACAGGAALWAAAAVGVATASLRPGTTFWVGTVAAIGASATGLLLYFLERRAGARGRRCLEDGIARGEAAIASAFHARLALGADGELLHRSTAWMQSAARVRETAARLLEMKALEVDLRSSSSTARVAATSPAGTGIDRYREASTIVANERNEFLGAEVAPSDTVARELRERFETWWTSFLLECDPTGVGGIPAGRFRSALGAVLGDLADRARSVVEARFEQASERSWSPDVEERALARFGLSSDLGLLSVRTLRARGRELERVVRIHSPSGAARELLARVGSRGLLGHGRPLAEDGAEEWNGLGVILEEIAIGLQANAAGRPDFIEGGRHAV